MRSQNRNDAARPAPLQWLEYGALRLVLCMLGGFPRKTSRWIGAALAAGVMSFAGKLSRTGQRNLQLAFPESTVKQREQILQGSYRHLGWLLAEFAQMGRYTANTVQRDIMRYKGLEHYVAAKQRGKGVLVLTGHLGAWELSSFVHALLGHPMGIVIRRLDNPLVDALVNRIRCRHGNRILHKDDFARGLFRAMHAGETVGILMDTNMTPPQGVFVPFFGHAACTASGVARVAQRTGASVLPGFLLWHEKEGRYVLHFGETLTLQHTGDAEADTLANTARFTAVIEQYIRKYPDQWLWLHRRWKTRPTGEPSIY